MAQICGSLRLGLLLEPLRWASCGMKDVGLQRTVERLMLEDKDVGSSCRICERDMFVLIYRELLDLQSSGSAQQSDGWLCALDMEGFDGSK